MPLVRVGLKRLAKVPKGASFAPRVVGIDGTPTTNAIQFFASSLSQFWSTEFANSGVQWPRTQDVLVSTAPVQTQCSSRATEAPTDGMFLCTSGSGASLTYTFYWPVSNLQQNFDTDTGHAHLGLAMAEFWSVGLQDLFGSLQQVNHGQITKGAFAEQTLCLTGVYVRSIDSRGLLEQADLQTVANLVSALSGTVTGITAPDVTTSELVQGFETGLNSGDPGSCGISASETTSSTTT